MGRWGVDDGELKALTDESVGLLSALLQADTTNPPGNETRAAHVLREYFESNGLEAQLIGDLPERLNLILRLPGSRPGPALCLLGHTDVVPAEPDEWTLPPFSGTVRDGYVWGRGAVDMKSQVAAQAVAVARLARGGADFGGTVIYAATADEERGDYCGARWLVQNRPDLVTCDFLLNEGGGIFTWAGETPIYPITVGEKGFAQFRITTRGKGGHGSVPLHDHNAVELMGRVITALADHDLPVVVAPITADYISRIVPDLDLRERLCDPRRARAAIRDLHEAGDDLACLVEPLLGITFSPTIARAGGEAVNVIPSHASIEIDCRMLPGQTGDDVRHEVERALKGLEGSYELDWVDLTEGNESPVETPLADAVVATMRTLVPESVVVPLHLGGFTDSRWFREHVPGAVAYGFCPFVTEDATTMDGREHAKDERIHIDDVPVQTLFFERVVHELLP